MGYSISHGGSPGVTFSTLAIENIGEQLQQVLGWYDWRQVKPIFGGPLRDYPELNPGLAARVGTILVKAAQHPQMSEEWRYHVRQIGDSALRAARAREPWVWS